MVSSVARKTPVAGRAEAGETLVELAERLVAACPAPALLVEEGGRLRRANPRAVDLLRLQPGTEGAGTPVRELLGVGWRELLVISRTAEGGLVAELPPDADGRRRGTRVGLEPVSSGKGPARAVVAFLETPSAPGRRRETSATDSGFEAIFGHDPALLAAKEAAARFARTLLPVLLLAETGTGKELFARALHSASPRRDRPFVAINCGALSPHLLESELFGYAPGAFTGASRDGHDGKIGAARGGTLFLDEVAEMPGPLQALLLRVLEDGTYYRVGESRPRQADVRLVCATCRDLPRLVAEGAFREDLFYRIDGACLSLPPVRRRTDVAELVLFLLEQLSGRPDLLGERTRAPRLSSEALEQMVAHPWPGNVRQLKTALQHALILCDTEEIRLEHLPARLEGLLSGASSDGGRETDGERPGPAPEPGEDASEAADLPASRSVPTASSAGSLPGVATSTPLSVRTLAEREADRLVRAVDAAGGNLSRASHDLGIARSTLYRRLRKHGLLA